jgi:hypothetical protein
MEIICLALGLEQNCQRMGLLDYLGRYRLEDFATTAFRRHRRGGLGQSYLPPENLCSFTSVPLKKPLLRLVPKGLKKLSAQLFVSLLEFSGVRRVANPFVPLRAILQVLHEHRVLVDEFYFQLIKQTSNNRNIDYLLKTWELFLIIATIFPCRQDSRFWVIAHISRSATDTDQRIACVALFILIRFLTRQYLGVELDYTADRHYPERITVSIYQGTACFGVTLYELMWSQKVKFPKLPIPYVLYYMINLLKERNAFRTRDIFKAPGNDAMVREILSRVNLEITEIARGAVNVVATLLKTWLAELPNPVIPFEMNQTFMKLCAEGRYLGFAERLPQVHSLTLVYIIGFLQEVVKNAQYNGLERAEIPPMFGPLIVHPARIAGTDAALMEKLTDASIAFFTKVLDSRDPSVIYPLNPDYLATASQGEQQRGEELPPQ